MIEHLESHESEWVETPMASRNKSLLKKWKDQLKVIRLLRQRMALCFYIWDYTQQFECRKNLDPPFGSDKDNESERSTTKRVEGAVKPASKTED